MQVPVLPKCEVIPHEAVEQAVARNDLQILKKLFSEQACELLVPTSEEIHNYFLAFSNDEMHYSLEELKQARANVNCPLLDEHGQLSWHIRLALPKDGHRQLTNLLKLEIARCFNWIFNEQGQLRCWVINYIGSDNLALLHRCFGESAANAAIYESFFALYQQLFTHYLSPADEMCSKVLIRLMQYLSEDVMPVINQLIRLEQLLNNLDEGLRAKQSAKRVYDFARQLIHCEPLINLSLKQQCLQHVCEVLSDPFNTVPLQQLAVLSPLFHERRAQKLIWQLVGVLHVFMGAFLVTAGSLLCSSTAFSTALCGLILGSVFVAGGIVLFKQGSAQYFRDTLETFVDDIQAINHEYQVNLG